MDPFYDWFVVDYFIKNKKKMKEYFLEYGSAAGILANMYGDKDIDYKYAKIAEESALKNKIETITLEDKLYPSKLMKIPDPSAILYIWGCRPDNQETTIAIVGSREASDYTLEKTKEISECLCKKGVVIVSGMAEGVDKAAHQAVLENKTRTIAVLGESLIYEKRTQKNKEFIKEILPYNGCVLSEVVPWKNYGPGPKGMNLVKRNRIISGLADAVLIAESAPKSGTNHTINFAREQGKKIYAIRPKKKLTQNYGYMMKLGQEGITLIEDASEILIDKIRPGF